LTAPRSISVRPSGRRQLRGPGHGPAYTKVAALLPALDDEAKKQGWVIIRIRNDWKKIFAFE